MTIYSLVVLLPDLEPVRCSMFSSSCCFLTHIQVSQETGKVVWYSHLFKNFPQFVVIHIVKDFYIINEAAAAAAAKSLQSCPTLRDPIDGSPLGSPIPGILQARVLECVAFKGINVIYLGLIIVLS